MSRQSYPLESIQIASPCDAVWERMQGTERARFCGECQHHVYNLSALTRREAEELIQRTEGRLCVRLYRREDGTVLTQDCPVGLRAARRRLAWILGGAAAALLAFVSWSLAFAGFVLPRSTLWRALQTNVRPIPPQPPVVGMMCPPGPPPGVGPVDPEPAFPPEPLRPEGAPVPKDAR
jgi:hypothetical protein